MKLRKAIRDPRSKARAVTEAGCELRPEWANVPARKSPNLNLPGGIIFKTTHFCRQLQRTAEVVCYALLGPAMLAPRFIVSPAAVTEPSVVPTFEHTFPLPILKLQARRLAGLPGTQPWLLHSYGPPFRFF